MNNEFNKTQKCKNILYRDWIKYNLDIEFRMYLQRYVQWRTQLQLIVTPLIFPQYKIIRGHKCCHIVLMILLLIEKWKQRAIVNEICKIKFKESLNVLTLVNVSRWDASRRRDTFGTERRGKSIIIKSNPPNEQASKGTFLYNLKPSKKTKLKQ